MAKQFQATPKRVGATLVALACGGSLLATMTAANAEPPPSSGPTFALGRDAGPPKRFLHPADAAPAAARPVYLGQFPWPPPDEDFSATCFNSAGGFKAGTTVWVVDWNNDNDPDWDECFGISPGRGIWHDWPGRNWQRLANTDARADHIWGAGWYSNTKRYIWTCVESSDNVFETTQDGSGGWTRWVRKWETDTCRELDL